MKERPILFSAPMVRALLDCTKTQTRRICKVQPTYDRQFVGDGMVIATKKVTSSIHSPLVSMLCPYGERGDRLWARETWAPNNGTAGGFLYRGDYDGACSYHRADLRAGEWTHAVDRWRPSIHMPRAASRILLEIVSVRVERLQDISEADALAEGVSSVRTKEWDMQQFPGWRKAFDEACARGDKPPVGPLPSETYRALWESINGAGSWDANPFVWMIEFKRVAQ